MAEASEQEEQTEWAEGTSYADYGFASLEEFQAAAHQQQQMMMMMMGGGMYDDQQAQLYGQMLPFMPSYSRMPLPTEMVEETPTYVNAKQYRRIIKRRQARSLLDKRKSIPSGRKNYLHESRHKHACNRPRGPGGRFLTKGELESFDKLFSSGMSKTDAVAAAVKESEEAKRVAALTVATAGDSMNTGISMPIKTHSNLVVPVPLADKRRLV